MPSRWTFAVPLLTGLAALGAVVFDAASLAVVLAAVLAGAVFAGVTATAARRRVASLEARLERVAQGGVELPSREVRRTWRGLEDAVDAVGRSMQRRLDEAAGERVRVERLLEGLPSAVLLFDDRGLAYANAAARELFALPEGRAQTPAEVLGAEGLAGIVEEAHASGEEREIEVDRRARRLHGRAAPAGAGEVALIVSDLTEARRLDAVRRDFVTNASHELKTPVAGIQALSESLELALAHDPERARRMIARMRSESERLAVMVRDLLDLARLEELAVTPRRKPVDVAEITRGQIQRLAPQAQRRQVEVRAHLADGAVITGVPEDVRLIVGNVVENAVRYNREGGTVDVAVTPHDGRVEIEVADTGYGIPEADRERIFERFYRIDEGRSRLVGGSGLGLALVRHAVQRAGGGISLDSAVDEGSTFTISLPVEPPPPAAQAPTPAHQGAVPQ